MPGPYIHMMSILLDRLMGWVGSWVGEVII